MTDTVASSGATDDITVVFEPLPGNDHRRTSFLGLILSRIGAQPFGLVMGSYLTLLVATRASSAVAITFALTAHRYLSFFVFPIAGRLSDRTLAKFGRRVPYIVCGLLATSVAVWLFTVVPGYWPLLVAIVVARESAIVHRLAGIAVTPDVFGRSRWVRAVLAIRVATLLPGLGILAVIRFTWDQADPHSWDLTFRLAAAGLLLAALAVAALVREAPGSHVAAQRAAAKSWRDELRNLSALPNMRVLLATAIFLGGAGAATSRLFPVWANRVLGAGAPQLVDMTVLTVVFGVIAGIPGVWLAGKAHPRTLAVFSALVGAVATGAHFYVTDLRMFVVAATISIPFAVAAVVAGLPMVLHLIPPGESLGETIGLLVGPFMLVTSFAGWASAAAVDASGDYRLIWLVAAACTLGAAAVLTQLDVPPGMERTDVRDLLRRARAEAGGSGGLFGGTVEVDDVLAGDPAPSMWDARPPTAGATAGSGPADGELNAVSDAGHG
jgi:hypothetical protein